MPTIKFYEQVGEISFAQLRTAEENAKIAEDERARQAEEFRIAEEERKRAIREQAMGVCVKIADTINKAAEKGYSSKIYTWYDGKESYFDLNARDFVKMLPAIKEILVPLGYKINDFYYYSDSWTRKSGKVGYITITWG